tara:strand:- start:254 stop:1027 length:774 start_codon:yes stop_codon:yes gene_type:complete
MKRFLSLFAFVFVGHAVSAETVTLTFDEFACGSPYATGGKTGVYAYGNPNQYSYDNCGERILLGDDGWSQSAGVLADAGTYFDLKAFDLNAYYAIYRFPRAALQDSIDAAVEAGDFEDTILLETLDDFSVGDENELKYPAVAERLESFDYFRLAGYRDGALVAEDKFDPKGVSTYEAGTAFADLSSVTLSLTVRGYATWFDDDYLYGCAIQCGYATYDNVVLQTAGAVSPVPLPAGAALLGVGLFALWPLRRRQARR